MLDKCILTRDGHKSELWTVRSGLCRVQA